MSRKQYTIGYGRPPKHTRFRKGKSGNPRGRPTGHRNLKAELMTELSSRIPVTENGRRKMLSKQTVIVKRMVADAAKGDSRARDQLLRLIGQMEADAEGQPQAGEGFARDTEILARFRARLLSEVEAKKR